MNDSQGMNSSTAEPGTQVEVVNGKNVFVWTGLMTGCQSKVAVLEEFAKQHPNSSIRVIFNSDGGGVDDCREAYNRILIMRILYKMHFTFVVLKAKSCAFWFIQCADVRIGLPHTALMYHCVRWKLEGAKSEHELSDARRSMMRNQAEFTEILCSRSPNPKKAARKLMNQISDGLDYDYTAKQAVKKGWLDAIYTPEFSQFSDTPDLSGLSLDVKSD